MALRNEDERRWTKELIAQFWGKMKNLVSPKADKDSPALTGIPTAPTAESGTKTDQIATTKFVMDAFAANDAMIFKGTIGSSSSGATVTSLPATHEIGWTYKVITEGRYAGHDCEVGDMLICIQNGTVAKDSDWAFAPIDEDLSGLIAISPQEIAQIFSDF